MEENVFNLIDSKYILNYLIFLNIWYYHSLKTSRVIGMIDKNFNKSIDEWISFKKKNIINLSNIFHSNNFEKKNRRFFYSEIFRSRPRIRSIFHNIYIY